MEILLSNVVLFSKSLDLSVQLKRAGFTTEIESPSEVLMKFKDELTLILTPSRRARRVHIYNVLSKLCCIPYGRREISVVLVQTYQLRRRLKSRFNRTAAYMGIPTGMCMGRLSGKNIAVCETSPHRYGKSLTIWDHTVLPATRQR